MSVTPPPMPAMPLAAPTAPLAAPVAAPAPLATPAAPGVIGATPASPVGAAIKAAMEHPSWAGMTPEAKRAQLMGIMKPAPLGAPQGPAALHPVHAAVTGGMDPGLAIQQHVFGDNP